MQKVLANLLLAHAPLQALVGNKIQWDAMGQGQTLPFVVMYVVSGITDYTMAGATGYVETRVQFDARGRSAAEARSIAEAIRDRLSGFSGVFAGFHFMASFEQGQRTRHDKDGTTTWFTDSRDYTLHWRPA